MIPKYSYTVGNWFWRCLLALLLLCTGLSVYAQDATATPEVSSIRFSGTISDVTETTIVVNGLTVQTSVASVDGVLVSGATVEVQGTLLGDGQIQATTIEVVGDDPAPEPTQTPVPVEISGEITAVGDGTITVGSVVISVEPVTVNFSLTPGTMVRVVGTPPDDDDDDDDNINLIAISITLITPGMTPEATSETTPEATPETTPETTPEVTETPTGDDGDVIIVIEGPVEAVSVNIIVIYGFEVEIDDDDPALTVIQVGDTIRIEGVVVDDDDDDDSGDVYVTLTNITIVFVNINVFVNQDSNEVWRGDDCGNPPPPWAPAFGWRERCEGGAPPPGRPGRGRGGNDNDDDD